MRCQRCPECVAQQRCPALQPGPAATRLVQGGHGRLHQEARPRRRMQQQADLHAALPMLQTNSIRLPPCLSRQPVSPLLRQMHARQQQPPARAPAWREPGRAWPAWPPPPPAEPPGRLALSSLLWSPWQHGSALPPAAAALGKACCMSALLPTHAELEAVRSAWNWRSLALSSSSRCRPGGAACAASCAATMPASTAPMVSAT